MKVAFLSFYNGIFDRGVEVATNYLALGLAKKHQVDLFQAGERVHPHIRTTILAKEIKKPHDSSGSRLRLFYLDYYSRRIAVFSLFFLKYLFKEKYDVVVSTNGGWQVLIVRIATWIAGKKMIVQGNAGIGRDDLWQLLCFPDHYIAISPQGYKWAQEKTHRVPVSFIPHGVDTAVFQKIKPADLSLKLPVVLCVAAFVPYKRIGLLIEAMDKVPTADLVIIGEGPLEGELKKLGEKLLNERFLLLTGINHDKLLGYYKAAAVFSLPSRSSEALGIVYIEAMAAGLTIVAPDDDNRRSVLGKAGIYTDVTNSDIYAASIKEALTHPRAHEARIQAKKYDWPEIVTKYNLLLKNL